MADINNYYPHTLKTDEYIEDDYSKNLNKNNLQNLQEDDEYVCVFENLGIEYPKVAMGVQYKYARTKGEKKDLCESMLDRSQQEGLIYIPKDDWINPDEAKYECGVFNSDGSRKKYIHPPGNPDNRKFVSKKLCDKYNDKNQGYDFYTKMIPAKLETPAKDLRSSDVSENGKNVSRNLIFWITYLFLTILIIYWVARYQVNRPYSFYDSINSTFITKVLFIIIVFGFYIYIFCPFNMCFPDNDSMKNLSKFINQNFCSFCNNNVGYIENNIYEGYDRSISQNFFLDLFYNFVFKGNRHIQKPLRFLNDKICTICNVDHKCFFRKPYNTMNIVKPSILIVSGQTLQQDNDSLISSSALSQNYEFAINLKYKYKYVNTENNINYYVPYNSGTLIYLRTNDSHDKKLFMSCLTFNLGGNKSKKTLIDENDFSCKWVLVKDRNGPTIYNFDFGKLRIKVCPYSNRIFSVASNYELLDYNMTLDLNTFIYLFETDILRYTDYPFFPSFNILELKQNVTFSQKPDFIKRKLLFIYKYLIRNPSYKLRTKNVAIVEGDLVRYDSILSARENLEVYSIKENYNSFITYNNEVNYLKSILENMNEHYNDDEDDNIYLSYYNDNHEEQKKDFYLTSNYKLNYDDLYEKLNIEDTKQTYKNFLYKLNQEFTNLNYVQREEVRQNITKKLLENFYKSYDEKYKDMIKYFKKNKNKTIYEADIELQIDSERLLKYKEIFKLEDIISYHNFENKTYEEGGISNKCIFCKQKCFVE